jgi:hypothetical protein
MFYVLRLIKIRPPENSLCKWVRDGRNTRLARILH